MLDIRLCEWGKTSGRQSLRQRCYMRVRVECNCAISIKYSITVSVTNVIYIRIAVTWQTYSNMYTSNQQLLAPASKSSVASVALLPAPPPFVAAKSEEASVDVWALGGSLSRRSSARHSRRVWCVRADQYSHCASSSARRSSNKGSCAGADEECSSFSVIATGSIPHSSFISPSPFSSSIASLCCGSRRNWEFWGPDWERERLAAAARRGFWGFRFYKIIQVKLNKIF